MKIPSEFNPNEIRNPSLEYEKLRRRLKTNIQEFWNFINAGEKLSLTDELTRDDFLQIASEHRMSLLNDIEDLENFDTFKAWRIVESENLSDLIQSRLHNLQNPKSCNTAKKLVCRLNKGKILAIFNLNNARYSPFPQEGGSSHI